MTGAAPNAPPAQEDTAEITRKEKGSSICIWLVNIKRRPRQVKANIVLATKLIEDEMATNIVVVEVGSGTWDEDINVYQPLKLSSITAINKTNGILAVALIGLYRINWPAVATTCRADGRGSRER